MGKRRSTAFSVAPAARFECSEGWMRHLRLQTFTVDAARSPQGARQAALWCAFNPDSPTRRTARA